VVNATLNLCLGGLQEIGEAGHLKVELAKVKIVYHGSVGDVGPSTSISGLSMSIPNPSTNIPILSTS